MRHDNLGRVVIGVKGSQQGLHMIALSALSVQVQTLNLSESRNTSHVTQKALKMTETASVGWSRTCGHVQGEPQKGRQASNPSSPDRICA
jgi:hypothetical protein